ncbi:MAG: PKD domain-containing protein [Bacteroidia bacterium]
MKNNSKIQLLAFFFAALFSINAKSQCPASFSYTLNATGNVTFSNTSSSTTSNTIYNWDFGDTQFSNQINPNHTYAGNGTYVVTFTTTDTVTPCSSSVSQTITISNTACLLNASFYYALSTTGMAFFGNTTTGSIPLTSYTLNWGDGNTNYYTNNILQSIYPTHNYTVNGNYMILLQAQNSTGCVSSYTAIININIQPCTNMAGFTYTVNNNTVSFSDASTGTSTASVYSWDFGNNYYGNVSNPLPQNYPSNGQYVVSLTVFDYIDSTCTSTQSQTITLTNALCVSTSTFYLMQNSTSSSIVWDAFPTYPVNVSTVVWNWGDNTSSTGLYPSHTYSATGFYNICLTVSVSCGSSTTTCINQNIFKTNNSMQMATVNVLNSIPTSIGKNISATVDILLFPNPVKDVLTIENNATDFNVSIIDLYGKVIYTGTNAKNINVQNFNAGIYFVKISGNNFSKTSKIIKD